MLQPGSYVDARAGSSNGPRGSSHSPGSVRTIGASVDNNADDEKKKMETGESKKEQNFELFPFIKAKDKARSTAGTFGIPFGVSGPRPVQEEARVLAAETVPAGFILRNRDKTLSSFIAS